MAYLHRIKILSVMILNCILILFIFENVLKSEDSGIIRSDSRLDRLKMLQNLSTANSSPRQNNSANKILEISDAGKLNAISLNTTDTGSSTLIGSNRNITKLQHVDAMLDRWMLVPKFPKGTFPSGYLPPPTVYQSHNILFCGIPKNSMSQFRAILCRTLDKKLGTHDNITETELATYPYHAHYMELCIQNETLIPNNESDTKAQKLWTDTVRKLAVIRDPIERFISGVVDKCVRLDKACFGCFDGFRPTTPKPNTLPAEGFLRRRTNKRIAKSRLEFIQKRNRRRVNNDKYDSSKNNNDNEENSQMSKRPVNRHRRRRATASVAKQGTADNTKETIDGNKNDIPNIQILSEAEALSCFAEKSKREITKISKSKFYPEADEHSVNHFMPQYWFCDFQSRLDEYTLLYYNKSEPFKESARKLLLNWDVEKSLILSGWGQHLNSPFLGVETQHSSSGSTAQRYRSMILSNLTLLNRIFTEYYVDYHYFRFRLPGEAKNLCLAAGSRAWEMYAICGAIQIKNWPLYSVPRTE